MRCARRKTRRNACENTVNDSDPSHAPRRCAHLIRRSEYRTNSLGGVSLSLTAVKSAVIAGLSSTSSRGCTGFGDDANGALHDSVETGAVLSALGCVCTSKHIKHENLHVKQQRVPVEGPRTRRAPAQTTPAPDTRGEIANMRRCSRNHRQSRASGAASSTSASQKYLRTWLRPRARAENWPRTRPRIAFSTLRRRYAIGTPYPTGCPPHKRTSGR